MASTAVSAAPGIGQYLTNPSKTRFKLPIPVESPGQPVQCVVFTEATRFQVKEHSARMRELLEANVRSHLGRVLSVKSLLLADPELDYEDFKRFRNVIGMAQSKEGKKLERDYKIAVSDQFFLGVMGINDLSQRPLRPSPDQASYTYEFCANKLVPILGVNTKAIEVFHDKLDKYLADVRRRPHPPDFEVKPIHKWKPFYDPDQIVALAENSVRESGYVPNLRMEDKDQEWRIDQIGSKVKLPPVEFDRHDLAVPNIKRKVDLCYKSGIIHYSTKSDLAKMKPRHHGDPISIRNRDLDPGYESPMKNLEFDSPYAEIIRESQYLYYSARPRLIKSLGLRADRLGFDDYNPNSESTYTKAASSFSKWFDDEFLGKIFVFSRLPKPEDHPRYRVYSKILEILKLFALHEGTSDTTKSDGVKFKDFCNQVFRQVFEMLDAEDEIQRAQSKMLFDVLGPISTDELSSIQNFIIKMRNTDEPADQPN